MAKEVLTKEQCTEKFAEAVVAVSQGNSTLLIDLLNEVNLEQKYKDYIYDHIMRRLMISYAHKIPVERMIKLVVEFYAKNKNNKGYLELNLTSLKSKDVPPCVDTLIQVMLSTGMDVEYTVIR